MKYNFTVPGEPRPKQRVRVCRNGHSYTPKETIEYEKLARKCFQDKYQNARLLENELRFKVVCYFKIPESKSKKEKEKMLSGEIWPTKRADWDNLGKLLSDSLNGIAYKDDAQIVIATVEKIYSINPRVEIIIEELDFEAMKKCIQENIVEWAMAERDEEQNR